MRITWPNGLIQNEIKQATNKSYTLPRSAAAFRLVPHDLDLEWRGFQFITDVLGVAPLGASDGEGSYFPVDHDEYVQIPASALPRWTAVTKSASRRN